MAKPEFVQSLWARLQRRDKWPRRWWYPLQDRPPQKEADEVVQKGYDECVLTVRRTMLALLGFCLFCIVTSIGTPDSALITTEAQIKLPFADTHIASQYFLVAAPLLLIVLTIYLHVFDSSRLELEASYKVTPTPTLFTLNRPIPNALTKFIFFWSVPMVLAVITWKAMARPSWWLLLLPVAVTASLVWIQIRRCPVGHRLRNNLPRWGLLIGLVCLLVYADAELLRRPLNLFRVDFSKAYLANVDLQRANLQQANLQGVNFTSADLDGANLTSANLRGANLAYAGLRGAHLRRANLQDADLSSVWLQGADLSGANLQGVDLHDASLEGADLSEALLQGADLTSTQLHGVDFYKAKLQGANLERATMPGARLKWAELQGANFYAANLHGVDFDGANLQGADLFGAILRGADLDGAKLQGAVLSEAMIWLTRPPLVASVQDQCCVDASQINIDPPEEEGMGNLGNESVDSYKIFLKQIKDVGLRKSVAARLEELMNDKSRKDWHTSKDYQDWAVLKSRPPPDAGKTSAFLATLACGDDTKGAYLARALVRRMAPQAPPFASEFERVYASRFTRDLPAFYKELSACVEIGRGPQQQRPMEFLQAAVQHFEKAQRRRSAETANKLSSSSEDEKIEKPNEATEAHQRQPAPASGVQR